MNSTQARARKASMVERAEVNLRRHFPDVQREWLWLRSRNDGYTTVPRTMPIAMHAIDAQTKGQPAGHTLFCLWARAPDHPMITIESPPIYASEAGFSGFRAVDTWRRRMKRLQELGFIKAKQGVSGNFHFVLLLNPNVALECMHKAGKIQEDLYQRFLDRVDEVGAHSDLKEIHEIWEEEAEAAMPKPAKKSKVAKNKRRATPNKK